MYCISYGGFYLRRFLSALFFVVFILFSPALSEAYPRRIVSLCPVGTEILFALGQGDNIVGVTDFCDYPPEAREKPRVGGFSGMNFESLLEWQVDLLVVSDWHLGYVENIKKLGIAYSVVRQGSIAEICASIEELGRLCGAETESGKIISQMRAEIERISGAAERLPKRSVLLCISRELSDPKINVFYAAGKNCFYDELISLAGGVNAVKDGAAAYPKVSAEGLLALDPEVIIELVGDGAYSHSAEKAGKDEIFSDERIRAQWLGGPAVRAVRGGRVCPLSGTVYLRPGPRITEILKAFVRAIHPEAGL